MGVKSGHRSLKVGGDNEVCTVSRQESGVGLRTELAEDFTFGGGDDVNSV